MKKGKFIMPTLIAIAIIFFFIGLLFCRAYYRRKFRSMIPSHRARSISDTPIHQLLG